MLFVNFAQKDHSAHSCTPFDIQNKSASWSSNTVELRLAKDKLKPLILCFNYLSMNQLRNGYFAFLV